jgi:hypothetical protein
MNRFKSFLIWVLKISAVFVVVIMAIVAIFSGWEGFQKSKLEAARLPLAQAKTWPVEQIKPLGGVNIELSTKWRDHQLLYQFKVIGYPKGIELAREKFVGSKRVGFTIYFRDAGGFKVFSHHIPLNEMSLTVGPNGEGIGLTANSKTSMNDDDYRNATTWDIEWSIPAFVERPPAPPKPATVSPNPKPKADTPSAKWRNISLWRQLSKGMTQSQVEDVLGSPTKIEGGGVLTTWNYGSPGLGGYITFDDKGRIYSWSEP